MQTKIGLKTCDITGVEMSRGRAELERDAQNVALMLRIGVLEGRLKGNVQENKIAELEATVAELTKKAAELHGQLVSANSANAAQQKSIAALEEENGRLKQWLADGEVLFQQADQQNVQLRAQLHETVQRNVQLNARLQELWNGALVANLSRENRELKNANSVLNNFIEELQASIARERSVLVPPVPSYQNPSAPHRPEMVISRASRPSSQTMFGGVPPAPSYQNPVPQSVQVTALPADSWDRPPQPLRW